MNETSINLEDASLFQGFSPDEMASVRQKVQLCSFGQGDLLIESGQDSPGLYVIRNGLAAIIVLNSAGQEKEVYSLGKGECVGEMALVTGEPCSATVRAITQTECWLIQVSDFTDLVERFPLLWRNLGRILSQKLVRTGRHLTAQPYANAVALVSDCADDGAAALGIAITASLARQTGRRVLLIDARGPTRCPAGQLAREQSMASLADVLRDPTLLREHELAPDPANGVWGARIADLHGEHSGDMGKDQILAVLEWLHPLYDHILLLARREPGELELTMFERARSVLTVITQHDVSGIPSWLDTLCRSPRACDRLEVALVTGVSTASTTLEALEERVGRPIRRLPIGPGHIQQLTKERTFLGNARRNMALGSAIDRLARHVGEMEVGLSLGGGAAKGFAHIGVLRVLEANSVPVDCLAGCSIGAIVGALYAGGRSLSEIEERLTGADRRITRWTLPLRSIWSDAGLKRILQEPGPNMRFCDLNIPFAAVATDIETGREVVLHKDLVWKAVQASVSIPGIFPVVSISGRCLVDGGLVNPVPSQTARDLGADFVVAVDLMSPAERTAEDAVLPNPPARASEPTIPNLLEMLWRSAEIMQHEIVAHSAATADLTIEPKVGKSSWSDFSKRGQDFIAAGEEAAMEKLPELRRLLPFAISNG